MIRTGSQSGAGPPSRAGWGWLLLVLALALPFLGRPWHLDDGVLMRHARTVLSNPLDPYRDSFDAIGLHWSSRYSTHPPLLWYVLAPAAAFPARLQPPAAHLLFLGFVLMLFVALRGLGPWGPDRAGCAFLLTSPLLIVQTHCIAWEMPVLACGLLALMMMVRGAETGRRGLFLGAAVPAAAALLMAYPGRIVPMMVLLGFLLGVPWRRTLGLVALTLVPPGLYELATAVAWGQCHFLLAMTNPLAAFSYAVLRRPWLPGLANMLAELGGLSLGAPLVALAPRRPRLAAAALLAGAAVAALCPLPGFAARAQMTLWSALGSFALGLVGLESFRLARQGRRTGIRSLGAPAFWAAWFWLEAVYCSTGIVHGSARYVLPLVPPLAFFAGREWARQGLGRRAYFAVVAIDTLFALLVSTADLEEVVAYAQAPRLVATLPAPEGRSFFAGAWGFQAAMEEAGHLYLHNTERLRPGDRIVRARNLTAELGILDDRLIEDVEPVLTHTLVLPSRLPLRLNDPESGAGFWWSGAGLLPVGFTRAPVDVLEVYEVRLLPPVMRAVRLLQTDAAAEKRAPRPHLVLARFGDGVTRAAIFLHPPAELLVDLGPGAGTLHLEAGILPTAGPGDGALARVQVRGHELVHVAGTRRGWAAAAAPVDVPEGGTTLELLADPGPAGDTSYDWLCVRLALDGPRAPPVLGARWTALGDRLLH